MRLKAERKTTATPRSACLTLKCRDLGKEAGGEITRFNCEIPAAISERLCAIPFARPPSKKKEKIECTNRERSRRETPHKQLEKPKRDQRLRRVCRKSQF
ncbi:hypothetical protein MTO96_002600 [Rhipicephalus appendiculatus]